MTELILALDTISIILTVIGGINGMPSVRPYLDCWFLMLGRLMLVQCQLELASANFPEFQALTYSWHIAQYMYLSHGSAVPKNYRRFNIKDTPNLSTAWRVYIYMVIQVSLSAEESFHAG